VWTANATIAQILCIHQLLKKKWEYNGRSFQLFMDFKKAYDSIRRDVLYKILIESGTTMKLDGPIKMCLNGNYSNVCIGKQLSDAFPIHNGQKQGDALSLSSIMMVYKTKKGLEINGAHQLLVYADDNLLGENITIISASRPYTHISPEG
jgi:hypothetical protein